MADDFVPIKISPARIAGCYELKLGPWEPPMGYSSGPDAVFVTPPARIRLYGKKKWDYLGKPAFPIRGVGTSRSIHSIAYWTLLDEKTARLAWSTGFSGLTMDVHSDGKRLRGVAKTFWDFPRTQQTATVDGVKIECPAITAELRPNDATLPSPH
jgi:hypothetical protein